MPTPSEIKNAILGINSNQGIPPEIANNKDLISNIRIACLPHKDGDPNAPLPAGLTADQIDSRQLQAVYKMVKNPQAVKEFTIKDSSGLNGLEAALSAL
ncbi:MAG: hypothetical protein ABW189_04210 [Rickettsiales bacterium]